MRSEKKICCVFPYVLRYLPTRPCYGDRSRKKWAMALLLRYQLTESACGDAHFITQLLVLLISPCARGYHTY